LEPSDLLSFLLNSSRAPALPGFAFAFALLATMAAASPAQADDSDPWVSRDKALHFDVSAGIAAAAYGVSAGWLVDARWKALALGGGVALGAGAAKELVDATGVFGGDPSWKDFVWDIVGTVAGLALAWGVDVLVGGASAQRPLLASP
jgi:putative lipoprotein